MDIKNQFATLYRYHWHTNNQLMDCASQLKETDYYHPPEDGPGSIHDLLFHILRADHSWLKALETGKQQLPINENEYPNLETLKSAFEKEQRAWQELLDSLTEDEIEAHITLTRINGDEMVFIRWRVLQHVILHGMQHHAEIAQLLTTFDQSPGNIDFLFYR